MSTPQTEEATGVTETTEEAAPSDEQLPRVEDEEILTGRATYIHDINPEEALTMVLVRSRHPHAEVIDIDTEAANDHDACVQVLTADDLREELNPMTCAIEEIGEFPLADDKTRFAGEPIAVVLVDGNRYVAEDVADLVRVEYETLEPVATPADALADESVLHEEFGSNIAATFDRDFGSPERAFQTADHVVEESFSWGRISGVPLETAGVVARYDADEDAFRIESNTQLHTLINDSVAQTLGYPEEKVDLHVPASVGGSFGTKISAVNRYCCLTAVASKVTERPVRYVEDRFENLQGGDAHSSDREYEVKLALDEDGQFRGLDVSFVDDLGAFPRYAINQAAKPLSMVSGTYDIQHIRYHFDAVVTNKTSQAPYRGFGVPPHNFVLEAIVDKAARVLDMSPTSLRRKNLLTPDQLPYKLPTKNVYDSGDYPAALDSVQKRLESERDDGGLLDPKIVAERREAGYFRGAATTVMVEPGVTQSDWRDLWQFDSSELAERTMADISDIPEHLRVAIGSEGTITAYLATDSAGQGHRTIITQILSTELDVDPGDIEVGYLGSSESPTDYGSAASRMAVMVSGAARGITDRLIDNLETIAAQEWDVEPQAVEYEAGEVVNPETGSRLDLPELVAADPGSLTEIQYDYPHPTLDREEYEDAFIQKLPSYATTAFAANAPIVEVDVETGEIEVLKFYSERDCGRRLNETIVTGQEMGGVAQGVGAALFEEFPYDADTGQPQAITMFDYTPPSIDVVPEMEFEHTETLSPFTENGAKGVGESGITDAPASIACSVNAALEPFGVVIDAIPMTPQVIRRTLQDVEA